MLAKTFSGTLIGLEPLKIEVEVDGTKGVPNLIIIGLPSKSVEEARERITSALLNCGIKIRAKRTVVNLAPADIKKEGSGLDLAITVALLQMYGELGDKLGDFNQTMLFGELALDGSLKPIKGALSLALATKKMGFHRLIIPSANQAEVSVVSGLEILAASHLNELITATHGQTKLSKVIYQSFQQNNLLSPSKVDFADIKGQNTAKRCLEIAAAGGHNLLLLGPPGSGKSMMAEALSSILPPLTEQEMIEVTNIHSICDLNQHNLVRQRPFRSPHHTISNVAMIGGGTKLRPGEISLAHRGVLFLDEFPEFPRSTLEALRQPLESGTINVARVHGHVNFPARLTLIAAANPCPCGYWGTNSHQSCTCSPTIRENYQQKLSGPILDRIDQVLHVGAVDLNKLKKYHSSDQSSDLETSATIQKRVIKARQLQTHRLKKTPYLTNSEIPSSIIYELCQLTKPAEQLLQRFAQQKQISARSYFKIIKVAQTITDLSAAAQIEPPQIAEALQYR